MAAGLQGGNTASLENFKSVFSISLNEFFIKIIRWLINGIGAEEGLNIINLIVFTVLQNDLIEVTKDFTTSVLATSFFVVHDSVGGGQNEETELTRGQQVTNPLFHGVELDIKTGRNDTTLVQTTVKLNNDFTSAMVINDFEFVNVTVFLHDLQELDDDLRGGTNKDLTLSTLFSIVNALKSIVQHADTDHL